MRSDLNLPLLLLGLNMDRVLPSLSCSISLDSFALQSLVPSLRRYATVQYTPPEPRAGAKRRSSSYGGLLLYPRCARSRFDHVFGWQSLPIQTDIRNVRGCQGA